MQNVDLAEEAFEKTIARLVASNGDKDPTLVEIYIDYGKLYIQTQKYDKALQKCMQALQLAKTVLPETHLQHFRAYNKVATVYDLEQEHSLALQYYMMALGVMKKVRETSESLRYVAILYSDIGRIHHKMDHLLEAYEFYQKAIELS